MISELTGAVKGVERDSIVIEVGGIGFEVQVTPRLASSVAKEDRIHVYTRLLVREDGFTLYGFRTREERACFDLLLSVRGVGARVSMSILSHLDPQEFSRAVLAQDDRALVGVPGVGKKTAGRMILELRDRIGLGAREEATRKESRGNIEGEALEGLLALGYTWQEARDALAKVKVADTKDLETVLREALRTLARS